MNNDNIVAEIRIITKDFKKVIYKDLTKDELKKIEELLNIKDKWEKI